MIAATIHHAAAMARIHASAFPPPERWSEPSIAEVLALPAVFGHIDPAGGFVLARAVADEAEILTLAVAPGARRQGLGRRLLHAAMATAGARKAAAIFLEVSAHNAGALALYTATGFVECGRRAGYYGGGADALVLRAPLTSV